MQGGGGMQSEVFRIHFTFENPIFTGVRTGMGFVAGCITSLLSSAVFGEIADYALGRPRRLSLH